MANFTVDLIEKLGIRQEVKIRPNKIGIIKKFFGSLNNYESAFDLFVVFPLGLKLFIYFY